MAKQPYMNSVSVPPIVQALASEVTRGRFTVSCPTTNSSVVYFKGEGDIDVPWEPGEWHVLDDVDLSTIIIHGTVGDIVTIVGGAC